MRESGGKATRTILKTRPVVWLKTHLPNPFQQFEKTSLTVAQKINLIPMFTVSLVKVFSRYPHIGNLLENI